jgi:glutamine amidotransferase
VIEVINLGLNNINSVLSALRSASRVDVRPIHDAKQSKSPTLLILPGTGAFGAAMQAMHNGGFVSLIEDHVQRDLGFTAGICLGMQLLGVESEESPGVGGLGLVEGSVERLPIFPGHDGRVPHVGWATLHRQSPTDFPELPQPDLRDVYFSHSFHLKLNQADAESLVVKEGERRFLAAFRTGNLSGYQFHPEKSSNFGMRIIEDLLRWSGIEN